MLVQSVKMITLPGQHRSDWLETVQSTPLAGLTNSGSMPQLAVPLSASKNITVKNLFIINRKFHKAGIFVVVFCLVAPAALAQRSLDGSFLQEAPTIDGDIGESEWSGGSVIDNPFVQIQPDFGEASQFRTVIHIGQTEKALYIAFEAFDLDPSRLAAAIVQRDGGLETDDSVSVAIDSFGDGRTAYLFRSNALATQEDGRIADNGRTVDLRWDAAWRSAARRFEDRWTVEFEIPFSILKYSTRSEGEWGINFVRTTPRRLETSLWSGPGETVWKVTSFGELKGLKLPQQESNKWEVIPYALAVFEEGVGPDYEAGIDIRWRPSTSLGIDLTLNPDFALIEADVEEINLTRFELRVPEKRPFFLEGNEMFSQRIRQFYSRRIGEITWGAKASGRLGKTDVSVIAASEDLTTEGGSGEKEADYSIVRFQRSLARGSNIGLLAANRSFQGENAGSVGIDTTMFFTNVLGMTGQLMRVHGPIADGGVSWFLRPAYDSSTTHFHVRYQELDEGIQDDFNAVGFLTDDNRKEFDTNVRRIFWPEKGLVERVLPMVNYNRYTSQAGELRSWELDATVEVVFRSGWEFEIQHIDEFKLFEKKFRNDRTVYTVGWDSRDGRAVSAYVGSGFNFDSDLTLYGTRIEWPFGDRWRLSYDMSRLELDPNPRNESTWIHVFETRYSFNPDLNVKLFVQTNSAINKENVQLLGVWRFKPPFGSLQIAFQSGNSAQGQTSQQGDSFFIKLAWPL